MNTSILSTAVPPPFREQTGHASTNAADEKISALAGMTPTTVSATTSAKRKIVLCKTERFMLNVTSLLAFVRALLVPAVSLLKRNQITEVFLT
jgi:hypothetical protein